MRLVALVLCGAAAIAVLLGRGVLAAEIAVGAVVAIVILSVSAEFFGPMAGTYWRGLGRAIAGTDKPSRNLRSAIAIVVALVAVPIMGLAWIVGQTEYDQYLGIITFRTLRAPDADHPWDPTAGPGPDRGGGDVAP